MTNDVDVQIINGVFAVLTMFDPGESPGEGTSGISTFSLPDSNSVKDFLLGTLPAPDMILTPELLKRPILPVTILFEAACLYQFDDIGTDYLTSVNLVDSEKSNANIMKYVWLTYLLGYEATTARSTVDTYKNSRGSANPFLNGSALKVVVAAPDTVPVADLVTEKSDLNGQSQDVRQDGQKSDQNKDVADNSGVPPAPDKNVAPGSAPSGNQQLLPGYAKLVYHEKGETGSHGSHGADNGSNGLHRADHTDINHSKKGSFVQSTMKDHRFSGDLTQPIDRTIRFFEMVSEQHGLTDGQKASFFIFALTDPALTFFTDRYSVGMSFESIVEMMRSEYNSDARMLHVRGKLTTLRLRSFMQEKEIKDVASALSELVVFIEQLVPQTQKDFRTDSHKIEYLRNAVSGFPQWSRGPIKCISTNKYTFNSFVTALHESIQTENALESASGSSSRHLTHYGDVEEFDTHAINHYGRPIGRPSRPKKYSRGGGGRPTHSRRDFEEARRTNTCVSCGEKWSRGHRCEKGAVLKHVRERIKTGTNAVHLVYELAQQFEHELHYVSHEDNSEESVEPGETHAVDSFDDLDRFDALAAADNLTFGTHLVEVFDQDYFITAMSSHFMDNVNEPIPAPLTDEDGT